MKGKRGNRAFPAMNRVGDALSNRLWREPRRETPRKREDSQVRLNAGQPQELGLESSIRIGLQCSLYLLRNLFF